MLFGLLVGVQLARYLGPSGYGIYGTAMAVLTILMIPTQLGLPQLVTREVAAVPAHESLKSAIRILHWARAKILLSSSVIVAVVALSLLVAPVGLGAQLVTALAIGLVTIPVIAMGNVYGAVLRGLHLPFHGQVGEFLIRPASVSCLLFLAAFVLGESLQPSSAMAINVIAASISATVAAIFLARRLNGIPKDGGGAGLPSGVSYSHALPMAMSEGMRVVASQLGVLALAFVVPNEEVGQYRVALQVFVVATMPSALVNIAFASMIASMYSQQRLRELRELNTWISILLSLGSAAALAACYLFGSWAVGALFGLQYVPSVDVLVVLLVGELVASLLGHPVVVLNMANEQRAVMIWSGVALAVNALVTVILVPPFGVIGAAIGLALGQIIWRGGCAYHAKRTLALDTSLITRAIAPYRQRA